MQRAAAKIAPATALSRTGAAAPPATRPLRGAALWATVGFVCGAIFWHAIGFWTLMSELVRDGREVAAAHDLQPAAEPIETGSLPTIFRVDPQSCISLELDRLTNRTSQRPCPPEGLALRLEPDSARGDQAVLADISNP